MKRKINQAELNWQEPKERFKFNPNPKINFDGHCYRPIKGGPVYKQLRPRIKRNKHDVIAELVASTNVGVNYEIKKGKLKAKIVRDGSVVHIHKPRGYDAHLTVGEGTLC